MEKLVLIDGHSILNRAFYGVPELTNSEGLHTNAVYGFLNIMFKILEEEQADHLAVAFDLSAPTFRHEKYPDYKGTRKPMPEELREQVPLMKEVLTSMRFSEQLQSEVRQMGSRSPSFRVTGISYSLRIRTSRSGFRRQAGERPRSMTIIRRM